MPASAKSTAPKLKIADFRLEVRGLNWLRHDLTGGTPDEFVKQNVGPMLEKRIAEVEALIPQVHSRFQEDIDDANSAIAYARKTIDRWHAKRAEREASQPQAVTPQPTGTYLYLVQ